MIIVIYSLAINISLWIWPDTSFEIKVQTLSAKYEHPSVSMKKNNLLIVTVNYLSPSCPGDAVRTNEKASFL